MHDNNIIYRDLKPENILLDNEGDIKLTDLGLARELKDEGKLSDRWPPPPPTQILEMAYTICGTPEYLAPEILLKTGYDRMVDYWTLGILLYELLTIKTSFNSKKR